MIFYGFLAWLFHLPTGGLIYSCFGAFLFSGYIVYDTYMIMQRLGPDEWVHGSISLYLDILNLFFYTYYRFLENGTTGKNNKSLSAVGTACIAKLNKYILRSLDVKSIVLKMCIKVV